MNSLEEVRRILADVLQLGEKANELDENSGLLGEMPEFDSMAVVSIITALEEQFDIAIEDDEITAETFETLGSLAEFVNEQV